MPRSSRTRVATMSLVVAAALSACGHFSIELLPAGEDGSLDGGDVDAGEDASASADGATDAPIDAIDAGCMGPDCPGTYVSASAGADTNPGTGQKPVKTIGRALQIAKQAIYIAGGRYEEKVTAVEGVSLLGGYECKQLPCSWKRDPSANLTTIANVDYEGLVVPKTVTRATLIEGLDVVSKEGAPTSIPGSVAILVDGGSPTIKRCRIVGSDTSGGNANGMRRSVGIAIYAPSNDPKGALVDTNVIRAGQASEESVGILVMRSPSSAALAAAGATIRGNNIKSGDAPFTSGIVAWASNAETLIDDNGISSGTSTGGTIGSWGIVVGGSGVINGNRVNFEGASADSPAVCQQDAVFCGGILSQSSATTITNNLVRGAKSARSTAVLLAEAEVSARTVVLNANTLDGGGDGGGDASISAAIVLRTSLGANATIGRVRNDILLGGKNKTRYGVYEDGTQAKTAHLQVLENVDFWNLGSTAVADYAYRVWDGNAGTNVTFAELTLKVTSPVPKDNLAVDPVLNAGFHLGAGSLVVDKGTTTEAPAHDIDREGRPKGAGIDIGADEAK